MKRCLYVEFTIQLNILLEQQPLIEFVIINEITDVYIYMTNIILYEFETKIRLLNMKLNSLNVKSWVLNGDRSNIDTYIDPEAYGPKELYLQAEKLVVFNDNCDISEKFYGFILDIEVADVQYGDILYRGFHNGIASPNLSTKIGSGIFDTSTEVEDRNSLLCDWLKIHAKIKSIVNGRLKLSCSLSNWTEDYYGYPVKCVYKTVNANWFYHMVVCDIFDEINIMAYSNTLSIVEEMVYKQLTYTDYFTTPDISISIETNNYGPTDKCSFGSIAGMSVVKVKEIVNEINKNIWSKHPSFKGCGVYDYYGCIQL